MGRVGMMWRKERTCAWDQSLKFLVPYTMQTDPRCLRRVGAPSVLGVDRRGQPRCVVLVDGLMAEACRRRPTTQPTRQNST